MELGSEDASLLISERKVKWMEDHITLIRVRIHMVLWSEHAEQTRMKDLLLLISERMKKLNGNAEGTSRLISETTKTLLQRKLGGFVKQDSSPSIKRGEQKTGEVVIIMRM
jgi:hypothetical protein